MNAGLVGETKPALAARDTLSSDEFREPGAMGENPPRD